jgi:hypothetical protein
MQAIQYPKAIKMTIQLSPEQLNVPKIKGNILISIAVRYNFRFMYFKVYCLSLFD